MSWLPLPEPPTIKSLPLVQTVPAPVTVNELLPLAALRPMVVVPFVVTTVAPPERVTWFTLPFRPILKVPLLPHVDPLTVTELLLPNAVEPIVAPPLVRLPPATISWLLAPSLPTVS